jgi:hypothetical protein
MTTFIPFAGATLATLSISPNLAVDKGFTIQGPTWLTDGSFMLMRSEVKRTAPIKRLLALPVVPGNDGYDRACEEVLKGLQRANKAMLVLHEDVILGSALAPRAKGRDNRRLMYAETNTGAEITLNADKIKLLYAVLGREISFWQEERKSTAPIAIISKGSVIGCIMPCVTKFDVGARKEHAKTMKGYR